MQFADLSLYGPAVAEGEGRLVTVGWLEPNHSFATGEVDEELVTKLVTMLVKPWQPFAAAGWHNCGFCPSSHGPMTFEHDGVTIPMGISNVFVPGDGVVYIAPSLILHYVDSHGYMPPVEFQTAVRKCPAMRSVEYMRAIRMNAPGWVAKYAN